MNPDQPPPRKVSIEELEKMLARDTEQTLEILPNGEIREYSEEEKAKVRSERKPLTMREKLGGEYAGSSFSVPVELAAQYKYEPYSPPEAILGSPEFDENLRRWIEGDASTQNAIDPSVPPPRSATLEEIIEATKHVPRRPRLFSVGHGPHYVAAIAASLAAEFPGMFAGSDVLGPVRVPPPILPGIDEHARATVDRLTRESFERGITRQIAAEAHVVVDSSPHPEQPELPPLEKRPGHRKGYKPARPPFGNGCKPAGSKLARKAARGKL